MRFDKIEIWDLMRSGIEDFKNSEHVTNALRAFDDGQFADPVFHFCFEKCGDELDLLALLNNWYCVTDADRHASRQYQLRPEVLRGR